MVDSDGNVIHSPGGAGGYNIARFIDYLRRLGIPVTRGAPPSATVTVFECYSTCEIELPTGSP